MKNQPPRHIGKVKRRPTPFLKKLEEQEEKFEAFLKKQKPL